ncbi:MAG: hypothetical protein KJP04_11255 [Arenicella sp.]|nr:hypothetical protein [Arenicella sp.]
MISRKNHIYAISELIAPLMMLCAFTGLIAVLPAVQAAEKESAWNVTGENENDLTPQAADLSEAAAEVPDSAVGQTDSEVLQEALQAARPQSPSRTATIRNRKLVNDIDARFKEINELLKYEDTFSPKVGELYFSYAALLLQAAKFEEARDAFTRALHVQKVNNGIYALEQRPALKGLFETMLSQGKTAEFEEYLNRIIWIESQHKDYRDDFTFDLLVRAGNFYIDQYMARPLYGPAGLELLRKANRYLTFAIKRYGEAPLNEKLMPHGELALVNTLEKKLITRVDRSSAFPSPRARNEFEEHTQNSKYLMHSFNRGEFFLKKYLAKAQSEKAPANIASALLQLGDLNQIYERNEVADQYYELAWMEIQKLPADHELRFKIAQPVELPAFEYSQQRRFVPTKRPTKLIPIIFAVGKNGKVANIRPLEEGENGKHFYKARSAARKLTFRPAIIDGKSVSVDDFTHDVRIKLSRKEGQENQQSSS